MVIHTKERKEKYMLSYEGALRGKKLQGANLWTIPIH